MALTANKQRVYEGAIQATNSLPIKASTEIFLGAAVGLTAGYARQLVAGDTFVGFADGHVNNSVATDGANTIPLVTGKLVQLSVSGVAVTDVGVTPVYASDSDTFTLTATSNSPVGIVYRYVSSGVCIVAFNVNQP